MSTASLMVGVAGSGAARGAVLTAGLAGLTAGSLAMAIGEYVSVSSQSDTETADADTERRELAANPREEMAELARIYQDRGLPEALANDVATALMSSDPLGAHLRDEHGQTQNNLARPAQAAVASAVSFAAGATVAVLAGILAPGHFRSITIGLAALVALVALGAAGAAIGGSGLRRGGLRVAVGGVVAMLITFGIGHLFGTTVR